MRRAQVVPVTLDCPVCKATYQIAVSRVKHGFGREEWTDVLPANCTHCLEPLDTYANHVIVRNAARSFL